MNTKKILLLSFVSLQIFSSLQGMDDNKKERPKSTELRKRHNAGQSPEAREVDREVFGGIAAAQQDNSLPCDPTCMLGCGFAIGVMAITGAWHQRDNIVNFFFGNNTQS